MVESEALVTITYGNGAGEALGDTLAICKPLIATGNIWYVNSAGGVDAASPAGQNREKPLATIQQAFTNALANDIIILMTGHTQTFTAFVSVPNGVTVVGAGSSGGKPTVKLFNNSAAGAQVNLGSNSELRNIWFPSNLQTNAANRVTTGGDGFRVIGCYFECGATDNAAALNVASGNFGRIVNSTFISTATLVTAQPSSAITVTNPVSDLELDGVVFSSGTVGFSNYRAFDGSSSAITRIRATNISQLLGADVKLNAASTGYWNSSVVTGGARLDW